MGPCTSRWTGSAPVSDRREPSSTGPDPLWPGRSKSRRPRGRPTPKMVDPPARRPGSYAQCCSAPLDVRPPKSGRGFDHFLWSARRILLPTVATARRRGSCRTYRPSSAPSTWFRSSLGKFQLGLTVVVEYHAHCGAPRSVRSGAARGRCCCRGPADPGDPPGAGPTGITDRRWKSTLRCSRARSASPSWPS